MRLLFSWVCCLLAVAPAHADELVVEIQVPRLAVAEYHNPYIATWIETPDGKAEGPVQLWYDDETKWLHHLRLWWRRIGRGLDLSADGITGATRAPGRHTLQVSDAHPTLADLPHGDHVLVVEAAREVGGRETLRIPFEWPVRKQASTTVEGRTELGRVTLVTLP